MPRKVTDVHADVTEFCGEETMAEIFTILTDDELLRLPPMILGTIRWRKYIGQPAGDYCSGFNIRVEEHTATEFRAVGGGKYERIPGTGIWKDVVDALSCRALPDEGDDHVLGFHVTGPRIHLNAFPDGMYRITPTLRGRWRASLLVFAAGYRDVEPSSAYVELKKDN